MLNKQTTLIAKNWKINEPVWNQQLLEWDYVKYTNMEEFCWDYTHMHMQSKTHAHAQAPTHTQTPMHTDALTNKHTH